MTRTRVVLAPQTPDAAPSFAVLDPDGHVLERGSLTLADGANLPPMRTVLIVPGAEARAHWLHLPTRNDRQARAAARLALDDHLASASQDIHVALGPLESDGYRLVVIVGTAKLKGWLENAALHGLRPDVVLPDHLALPEPQGEEPQAVRLGPTAAVRGPRLSLSAEPELLDVLLEGQDVGAPKAVGDLHQLFAKGALRPAINLLQGDFDQARAVAITPREAHRVLALALLALASPVILLGAGLISDEMAARGIENRTREKVVRILPAASREDPAGALEAHLGRMRLTTGGGPVGLAAHLFAAVEGIEQAQLERLIVMPDGAVRATLSYTNFSDIEMMRRSLRQAGVAMREEGAREEQGRVISDVIVGVRS